MYLITVNCERNDIADIRAGGPETLGYNFLVKTDPVSTVEFIRKCLKTYGQPDMGVFADKIDAAELSAGNYFSLRDIEEIIAGGYK